MNWGRKASSHRARAEQGLDDIAGLDWWVSREGIPGRENGLARGLEVAVLPRLW